MDLWSLTHETKRGSYFLIKIIRVRNSWRGEGRAGDVERRSEGGGGWGGGLPLISHKNKRGSRQRWECGIVSRLRVWAGECLNVEGLGQGVTSKTCVHASMRTCIYAWMRTSFTCVHVYMCIYVYVYMCIYAYVYMCMCIYVYMCICVCVYMCICVYVYMCMCIYVYMCICVCVYMCICVYVYMCMCIYVYMCVCVCAYVYITHSDAYSEVAILLGLLPFLH